jgi:hypothetical protein
VPEVSVPELLLLPELEEVSELLLVVPEVSVPELLLLP